MGIFDGISKFFGTTNESTATPFTANPHFDSFASQFGNYGAENYKEGREQQARQIDARQATLANYGQANQDRQMALQAREGQLQAGGLMMARATGQTPSIAGMQAQQDMQRAVAGQASMAASARGPAGLALAQQGAANNVANAQAGISGQAQINAANERLAAEQAAFGAMSGMRGQDYQGQGQSAQQAQFQAGMQAQNRAMNDARAMGYAQMGHQALGQEQQGRVQMQGIVAGNQQGTDAINAQVGAQNAGVNGQYLMGTVKAGQGVVAGLGNLSDARAKLGAQPIGGGLMLSDVTSKVGLAQLGGPHQANAPMSGPAAASFDRLDASGGMDVLGSLKAHSDYATRFQGDPSGGMMGSGLMLSDDRAKVRDAERQAYLLGRAHQMEGSKEFAYGGAPRANEEIVDRDPWMSDARRAEQRPEWLEGYMHEQGGNSSRAGLAMGLDPLSDRAGGLMRRGVEMGGGPGPGSRAGDFYAAQPDMAGAAGDRMTGQLARGLQPYAYEYKPGFGTEGQKVGPMAQEMAANDVTSTAVRQDPQTGLLAIDRDDGLKVALGGVGHLASKQAQQEALIAELLADRGRPSRRY
jgi:hypothetical protein